jgi:DNA-binding GntR family transcriptional regulator
VKPAVALQRRCMREPIRDEIVARILDGRYPAGTRLKELALAGEFNVSQAPVREALRELQALHLVETEHYRGTRVRAIDLPELQQAYELRLLIEQAAVAAAVPCEVAGLAKLKDGIAAQARAIARKRPADYIAAAVQFHRDLVSLSGNALFLRVWDQMHWDVRARVAAAQMGGLGAGLELRRKIVAALGKGDAPRAQALLAQILSVTRSAMAGRAQARHSAVTRAR